MNQESVTALTTNQMCKRFGSVLPFPIATSGVALLAKEVDRAKDGTRYWEEKFSPEQVAEAYAKLPAAMRQEVESSPQIYSSGERQYSRAEIHNALTNRLCGL